MKRSIISLALVLLVVFNISVFAETKVDTIREWIDSGIGDGESFSRIELDERCLTITVNMGTVDELYPGFIVDLATERAASITDIILDHPEFDEEWDIIFIEFENLGYVFLTKDEIETNEYNLRFFNLYDDDGISRLTLITK